MVENLRLLFRDVNTVHIDRFRSLQDWINEASNEDYWNQHVKCLLHPDTPLPEQPKKWRPLPPWRARQAANRQCLQITTQTTTKIMRTAAMQAAIMVTEMERGEDNTNTLPRRGEPPPRMTNNDHSSIRPPLPNTIQSSGSTKKISAYKLDAACFNHLQFSVSDLERLKLKLKSPIGNSPADIILIRMILQSLVSPHLKLLLSSSF